LVCCTKKNLATLLVRSLFKRKLDLNYLLRITSKHIEQLRTS
jgi:hypothetical protein